MSKSKKDKRLRMRDGGFEFVLTPCQNPRIKKLAYIWIGDSSGNYIASIGDLAKLRKILNDFWKAPAKYTLVVDRTLKA